MLNLAGTQATGAYIHLLRSTIDDDVNTLYVGSPDTPGLPVGMADEITAHCALTAYFTKLTHFVTPPCRICRV